MQPVDNVDMAHWRNARRIVIVVNDKTRPVPHQHLLPPLLRCLSDLGVASEQITFLIATGTHPAMTPDEFIKILPEEIALRHAVVSHDVSRSPMAPVGVTRRGSPVAVNQLYLDADVRIQVGNIEPHQFVGYSGTVKSVIVGLGSREFINRNHALMSEPDARMGVYEGNPPREDIDEAGDMVGLDFCLNCVMNGHGELVSAFAGSPRAVQQAGVAASRAIHVLSVPRRADIVIASAGGYPKDINIYQAQKGLHHACQAVRPGGWVILAAECREGSGSRSYEEEMAQVSSLDEVMERFRRLGFRVGYHKAFQLARDMLYAKTIWVSALPQELAARLLLPQSPSLEAALAMALRDVGAEASVYAMPKASSTVCQVTDASA